MITNGNAVAIGSSSRAGGDAARAPGLVTSRTVPLSMAVVALTASVAFGQGSLLQNGSFENLYANWATSGNHIILTSAANWPASDGTRAVVFNANTTAPDGVLSQTFATTIGQRYGLTFDLGTTGAISDQRLHVTVQGSGVLLDQIAVVAGLSSSPFYVPLYYTFVANSTSTTLTFADESTSYATVDMLLDNVKVVAETSLPVLTSQPLRRAVALGGTAVFSVTATGSGLTYQWQFNGVDISGATGTSHTVTGAAAGHAGNYRVRVSNATGSVTSSAATLTVLPSAILLNGSFEFGSAAWTFSNTNVSTTLHTIYGMTNGVQIVHFNAGQRAADGLLSQTFATTPGTQYILQFDLGAFSTVNTNAQSVLMKVQGTSTLLSQSLSVNAPGNGTSYLPQTFNFVADSATSTLSFQDTSTTTTNVDLLLDNVRITLPTGSPAITAHPQSVVVAAGSPASFSVGATGANPLAYQWRFNGSNISGATASTYTIASAQSSNAGSYDVIVSNGVGSVTSNAATLGIDNAPVIVNQPQSATVAVGGTANFSVTANGAAPLSYQWRKNGTNIGGATSSTYSIPNVQTGDAGSFDVIVSNTFGPTTSAAATLTVVATSLVNGSFESGYTGWTATGNQGILVGGAATDGANAVEFNSGQRTPNAVLTQTFATTVGQVYTLAFDLGAFSVANQDQQRMLVTLQGSTQLLSQTTTVNAPGNGAAYFARAYVFVADSTTTTLTLQDTSLTTLNVDMLLDNVRILNSGSQPSVLQNGSFETNYSGWSALGAQVIITSSTTWPPSDGTKVVVFNAGDLSGTGEFSQTFATVAGQRYGLTLDLGTVGRTADQITRVLVEDGSTGADLLDQTLTVSSPHNGAFYVPQSLTFVANSISTKLTLQDDSVTYVIIDSLMDNIKVSPESSQAPLITTHPQSAAVATGGNHTFSAVVSGTGLAYQWQFNGVDIPGATNPSYTVTAAGAGAVGNYRVRVTNGAGTVNSATATLKVLPADILLNGSFEYGSAAWTFNNSSVSVSTNPSYGMTNGVQIVHFNWGNQAAIGVLSQSFTTVPGSQYTLQFDVGAFSVNNTNPQSMQVRVQGNSTVLTQNMTVNAPGSGGSYTPKSYTFVADSTTSTLIFQDTSAITLNVDLLLDNVRVTVANTAPVITTQPQSQTVAPGNPVTFSVIATGTAPLSYQWRFNGTPISGATNSSFTISNVQAGDAGTYSVVVSNSVGPTTSDGATLTVAGGAPVITAHPQSVTVAAGSQASFSVTATGGTLTYQWRFNGAPIGGATSSTYTIASAQASNQGSYDVVVSNSSGPTTSNAATLTIQSAPVISAHPQSLTVGTGSPANFSVTATGGTLTYQWRFNGAPISGATSSTYSIASAQSSNQGSYDVVVSNAAGPTTSNAATLTVNPPVNFVNGSFESDFTGWTQSGNQQIISSGSWWGVTNGTKALAFNGGQQPANGVISQTFGTTIGQTYLLTFDVGAMSFVNQNQQRIQVTVTGSGTLLSQSPTVNAPGNGTTYAAQSFQFVANTSTTTLTFTDTSLSTMNVDLLLDNVAVTPASGAPSISSHPQSLTVASGSPASFSVTATGPGTLTYQWRFNGTPISGATSSTYSIASAQSANAGGYDVVVSNSFGPTTSNTATLTVNAPASFVNGSFESDYTGWTRTGNQVIISSGSWWGVTNGTKAVAFNGGQQAANGVLSQTFATNVGQSYTLTFDVGAMSFVNQDQQRMQVTVQGASTLVSQSVTVSAPGNGTTYSARNFVFVANSTSTTVTFQDTSLSTFNVDLLLDNVQVQ